MWRRPRRPPAGSPRRSGRLRAVGPSPAKSSREIFGRDGLARLAPTDELMDLGCHLLDLVKKVVDPRGHGLLEIRVADRRQVDEDVRRGPAGGCLPEECGDVEVA